MTTIGTWAANAACDPANMSGMRSQNTFSIGIFQWVAAKTPQGYKAGKVRYRVYGYASTRNETWARANEIMRGLNAGILKIEDLGRRSEWIGGRV